MKRFANYFLAGGALALMAASSAQAGGFQRGSADTDILFEKGTFSMRYGLTYVDPQRGFTSINGQGGDFGDYTGAYQIPSVTVAFGGDDFSCAGSYVESFAAEADYTGSPGGALPQQASSFVGTGGNIDDSDRTNLATAASVSRTRSLSFKSNEFGATCRVSYTNDYGRFSLLGGVIAEDFHFEGSSFGTTFGVIPGVGKIPVAATQIDVESDGGYKAGYRIGAAYEMPEIALRVQAVYRSEIKHDDVEGDGTVTVLQSLVPGLPAGAVVPITSSLNEAISPQSLTINAQTGIAADTLLLASFRWTDWSTNKSVISSISNASLGISSSSYSPYNWDDGYTASLGIGRAFNDKISGVVSLGYDSGVSTGSETTYTDLYTVSAGLSVKPENWAEIRLGGLIGFWSSGSQSVDEGAYFNGEVGDDMVYAGSASLKLSF
ncbi:long-chain fatty acid transporter [Aureimonas glaciei]|nr:long-chain fatty acid transporter [Aureimonas glaciei]